jgi:hypothetical protein
LRPRPAVCLPLGSQVKVELIVALLRQAAIAVVLLGGAGGAAIEALGVAADLAVEHVEIDDAERPFWVTPSEASGVA